MNGRMPDKNDRWQKLLDRIGTAAEATDTAFAMTGTEAAMLLKRRAVQLAQPVGIERRETGIAWASFRCGPTWYGIESTCVQQVIAMPGLTRVATMPAPFVGICNLKGTILPVVDFGRYFGGTANAGPDTGILFVLGKKAPDIGIRVDETGDLARIDPDRLAPVPGGGAACIRGLTENNLVILDGTALLADPVLYLR